MAGLNRGQRIAVLAGLAFLLYVLGHFIVTVLFNAGFVFYAPVGTGIDWTVVWQQGIQVLIWLALTGVWAFIAVRSLRAETTSPDGGDEP